MCAVAEKPALSPYDLLALPDEKNYELIDGELVERNVSYYSSLVGGNVFWQLKTFVQSHDLGWVAPADAGFQCFPASPRTVRRPDVSFVRKDRLPNGPPLEGWMRIAPDLAVEVISPNDLANEVVEKLEDYRSVGVPLIWIVDPPTRTVRVERADGTGLRLGEGDELSGEAVIPGFRCPVAAIFPPVKPAATEPLPA